MFPGTSAGKLEMLQDAMQNKESDTGKLLWKCTHKIVINCDIILSVFNFDIVYFALIKMPVVLTRLVPAVQICLLSRWAGWAAPGAARELVTTHYAQHNDP